jgi:phospholipid transport system substrate-binding protein
MTLQPALSRMAPNQHRRHRSSRLARAALAVGALAVALALAVGASADGDPMVAVKGTVNQVLSIVTDPSYKSATAGRRERLRQVIAPRFDFADMARSAMGYHWRSLSAAQRDQFVRLFTGLLEASYMGKIEGYKGQKVVYVKETHDGDLAQVNTQIVQRGNEPIAVNYRLKQSGGSWKVYDVLIDQISLVGNYRNQFSRIINEKGYDSLVRAIKQKQQSIDSGT